MVFLLSSSQWKSRRALASDVEVHRTGALQNHSGKSWFLLPGIACLPFFISWLNYALVSWKSLSIILLGHSDTQSRTDQILAPGFLNPANKLITGIQQMSLETGYILSSCPIWGAEPAWWRCRAYLCTVFVHVPPLPQPPTHTLPNDPRDIEVTSCRN